MEKTNIIGIAGKIGSGKDTVGKIIQYLGSECSNKKGTRYRTFERFVAAGGGSDLRNFDHYYYSEWEIKKFAGKLKEVASLLTGIVTSEFEKQDFKKTDLPKEWDTWYPNSDRPEPMTVRALLQKIGTDCMRDCLHKNVWVNALFADYIPYSTRGSDYEFEQSRWIITDCRFPNEAIAIKERGGILVKVTRPGEEVGTHESETALDNWDFDVVIHNNGTIDDLVEKVRDIFADII